jgi:tetratricopeptide (TPR) repeat protein
MVAVSQKMGHTYYWDSHMPDIALLTYNQEIKDLIDHGHFDEAVAHCQHVLETFPKYVETYRLLAKAFLEQSRHGEAADIFQRVLSVEPDDWLSHVAMAIVREDESNLDMAIWHMERAYEVNPSNTTVQQEIRRLRGRRDGVEPPKLRLTRAALARMYIKGGLFSQAIAEIHSALVDDPDRPDLQVLLASSLFEAGSLQEAADICNALLKKLPYCREANRILGLVLWNTGKHEEAEKFFQRLISLDPYVDTDTLRTENRLSNHPAQAILLPKLEWEAQLKTDKTKQPSWAASLGIKIEEPSSKAEAIPSWLNSPASRPSAPAPATAFTGTPDWLGEATASASGASAALPDWLGGSAAAAAPSSAFSSPSPMPSANEGMEAKAGQGTIPDWLQKNNMPSPEPSAPPSMELPSWANPSLFGSSEKKAEAPSQPEPVLPFAEQSPAWGKMGADISPASAPPAPIRTEPIPGSETDVPEWIKAATSSAPAATAPISPAGLPDWLSAPPPEQMEALPSSSLADWAKPEIVATPQVSGTSQLPDWLSSTRSREQARPAEPEWVAPSTVSEKEPAMPDWMQGIPPAPSAETMKPEDVPDWLSPQSPSEHSDAIPSWMQAGDNATPPMQPASTPSWMQAEDKAMPSTQPASTPSWMREETTSPASIPDWMKPEPESAPSSVPTLESAPELGRVDAEADSLRIQSRPLVPEVPAAFEAKPDSIIDHAEVSPSERVQPISTTADSFISAEPALSMPEKLDEKELAEVGESESSGPEPESVTEQPWPSWLTGKPAETMQKPASPNGKAEPAISLPDWLTGSTLEEENELPSPAMSAESKAEPAQVLPDWLQGAVSPPVSELPDAGIMVPSQEKSPLAPLSVEPKVEPALSTPEQFAMVAPPSAVSRKPTTTEAQSFPTTPAGVTMEPGTANAPTAEKPAREAQPVMPASIQPEVGPPTAVEIPPTLPQEVAGKSAAPAQPLSEKLAAQEKAAATPVSNVPLPDWLKPAKTTPTNNSIQDWDTAARQLNRQSPVLSAPGVGMPPSTPPAKAEGASPTDSQQVVDPVARWLDRRLKTSTLRSLDEVAMKGKPKTGELSPPRPVTGALSSAGATAKAQIPTWLDFQRPGASDTVVQWIDRRAPSTGRLVEEKLQSPPGEKIPTKPLVKSSVDPSVAPPIDSEEPEWLDRVKRTDALNAPSTVKIAAESGTSAKNPPATAIPPAIQTPAATTARGTQIQAASDEEDDGSPVPPPEWLQKALGKAVTDVPPVPGGKREQILWEEAKSAEGQIAAPKQHIPAKVPKYEQPLSFTPGSARTEIPAQAKRISTQALADETSPPITTTRAPTAPIQKVVRTWQSSAVEEPPPAPVPEAGQWMPIAPEIKRSEPAKQPIASSGRPKNVKSAKHKTRKPTEVESAALLKEARIYLETDLEKAATVYKRILEDPINAPAVIDALQIYLEQDPDSAALWNLLGDAYSRGGLLSDAYRAYAEALRRMG